ncbi:hypothetical protein BMS3Abin08_00671 [bacterium BMS3Abin08]|nr:hypothetical protein BMS3Abin08_00671 [bacterium BMS3Abin08]
MIAKYRKRWLADSLREAIEFSPVVVLSGARQTGKSTLLKNERPFKNWHYISFDDLDILALANKNPEEILNISDNMVIDEVQKSPDFIHAVKRAIDRDRSRRIVLSGSANLLLIKKVSESLAGRAIYFNLMPFAFGELPGRKDNGWFSSFLDTGELLSIEANKYRPVNKVNGDLRQNLLRGFLPPVAFLKKESHIAMWWKGYVKTYLESDLREISEISHLSDFRKMMELLALRCSNILKQSEIARDAALSQATAGRYINILEATGLFLKLRPYSKNISKRLIKSPKGFFIDSGLIASLAGFSSVASVAESFMGALFESYVLLNLIVRAAVIGGEVFYFRTQGGKERAVDFIFEKDNKIVAIEVKLSDNVSIRDINNMLFFKDLSSKFTGGLIIYAGKEIKQLTKNIFAIPWNMF